MASLTPAVLAELADERDDDGRRVVTRNGQARSRKVQTVAGAFEIEPSMNDPRVDKTTGIKAQVRSVIIPPVPQVPKGLRSEAFPLHPHEPSTGDFAPAMGASALWLGCRPLSSPGSLPPDRTSTVPSCPATSPIGPCMWL